MKFTESSVLVSSGEFPYIRFGTGEKNLVIIAGISMTGLTGLEIALVLAINYPKLIHSLILCSSCCCQNEVGKETFSAWSALAEKMDGNGIYRDFFARVYTSPNKTALANCLDTSTADQFCRFGILAHACLAFDCRDKLKKIQCPALVLGSAQDRIMGSNSSPELAERLGCECFLYQDFRQRVLDFLHKIQ